MKQRLDIWMAGMLLGGLLTAAAGAQSLGEYARQQRAQKPATPAGVKVYTNDNLPTSGGLGEVGAASSQASSAPVAASESAEKKEDRAKLEAEWRGKFKEQKDRIALLEREQAVRKGENQTQNVRYPMFYPQMAKDFDKNQQEIKEKQKELDDAKQRIEDMKEDLRKAGLPASWAD